MLYEFKLHGGGTVISGLTQTKTYVIGQNCRNPKIMAHHVLVQQYVVCVCVLCYAVAVLRDNRLTATDVTAQIRASSVF